MWAHRAAVPRASRPRQRLQQRVRDDAVATHGLALLAVDHDAQREAARHEEGAWRILASHSGGVDRLCDDASEEVMQDVPVRARQRGQRELLAEDVADSLLATRESHLPARDGQASDGQQQAATGSPRLRHTPTRNSSAVQTNSPRGQRRAHCRENRSARSHACRSR